MKFSKTSNKILSYTMILVIIVVSVLMFYIINLSMRNIYFSALGDMTNVAIHNIEEHVQLHKNEAVLIRRLSSLTAMITLKEDGHQDTHAYDEAFSQTYSYISKKAENSNTINNIIICDENLNTILSNSPSDIGETLSADSYYWNDTDSVTCTARIEKNKYNQNIILITQPVRMYNQNQAYVFIELSFDMLDSLINNYKFGDTGNLFFLTSDIEFIGSNPQHMPHTLKSIKDYENILRIMESNNNSVTLPYRTEFKNKYTDRYMQYKYIESLDAMIMTSIDKNEINKSGLTTAFPLVFLLVVIFSLILFYRYTVSKKILHPLGLLNRSLYMLKKGDLRARYNYNKDDEFGSLSAVFNQTISSLQKSNQILKEREAKSQILLERITDVIWEYDLDTSTIKLPESWPKLIGADYTDSSLTYSIESFMNNMHISYPSEFRKCLESCIKQDQPIKFECQIKKQNGEYFWVHIDGACMYNIYEEPYKVIGSIFDVTEDKKREAALRDVARRDDMTKLYKKVAMEQLVTNELEKQVGEHSLLFLDLDAFKAINDTYGHLVGDEVIIHVSHILKRICGDDCYICRFGGDEFVIFTRKSYTLDETKALALTILEALNSGYTSSENQFIFIGCSIGIARSPVDATDYAELMAKADLAIYRAKKNSKNCFVVYKDEIEAE